MIVLSIENISKSFRQYRSELARLASWFGYTAKSITETEVLRNVNFKVRDGEAIGIIGQNGAGKSTLLKIITGTLRATHGKVILRGRVAAILELGMGLNPEFTGRQNVTHAAGLMGFNPREIAAMMPEIEAFAEVGAYFDEPMRTYSSGMQMRVAFAVATAWRPDVLIVDEALSVGDTYFQHKCFARIRHFRECGTSLLLVSHDRSAIQSICGRAILIERGEIIKDSSPEEVFDFYNALVAEKEQDTIEIERLQNGGVRTSSGTGEASVEQIEIINSKGEAAADIGVGERVKMQVRVSVNSAVETLVFGYGIKDRLGQVMYGTNTWHSNQIVCNPKPGEKYLFTIEFTANFGVGSYSVQTALVDRDTHLTANYEWIDMASMFRVVNYDKPHFAGAVWSPSRISIEKLAV